jgi:DNA gyrase subunit A
MKVADVSEQGRATQGVKLIRLDEGDEIAAITQIDEQEEQTDIEIIETPLNGNEGDATDTGENPSSNGTSTEN